MVFCSASFDSLRLVGGTMPGLIDIGLNLTHDSFDHDRDAVLARAQASGVAAMLITGSDIPHSAAAIKLAHQHAAQLRATAGIHPHHAKDFSSDQLPQLQALLADPLVLAVGECGLDYFRNFSTPQQQEAVFRQQLELAVTVIKPVFLHERDAHDIFVGIIGEYRSRLCGGVAHCFTGTAAQAQRYVELDLYVGITGWICDERRGEALREAVRLIPQDRLLIETDAPYLIPRDLKPKPKSHRNEPMYLPAVLNRLAMCRGESVEELAEATTANARRLFSWH
jgi:TatD DNase family protein